MTTEFEGTFPLAAGVIRGLRAWNLSAGRLYGVLGDYQWSAGENEASCPYRVRHRRHPIACRDCSCGFYAYTDPRLSQPWTYSLDIVGVIEGYGLTQIGTLGFRCAKARIIALSVSRKTLNTPLQTRRIKQKLAEEYKVPVYYSKLHMLSRFPLGEITP